MPPYHQRPATRPSSSTTATTISSKYRTALDFHFDNEQTARNRLGHAKWLIDMGPDAAVDHAEVAGIFGQKPGSKLPPIAVPVVGVDGCNEASMAEFMKAYVADIGKRKKMMLSLYSFILGSLTDAALSRLKNSAMWSAKELKIVDGNNVHLLLQAINIAFSEGEGENAERADIDAFREVFCVKQGAEEPFTEYIDNFENLVENISTRTGYEMPPKLQVVALLDGVNDRLDAHRQEIIRATTVTNGSYPANVAKFRETVFRIDSTMKGSSAFSVDTGSGKRPPVKAGQFNKDQSDRYIEKLKKEKKTLIEDIKKLREENKKLKSRAAGGERQDKSTDGEKPDDKRGDKRGGDKRGGDRRDGGGSKKPKGNEQRSLPPGAKGKNIPIVDANAADADYYDSDYDSDE